MLVKDLSQYSHPYCKYTLLLSLIVGEQQKVALLAFVVAGE